MRKSQVTEDVKLFVPRFKVTSQPDHIKEDGCALGVTDAFSRGDADFSRLGESGSFWIDDLIHHSEFVMDEHGANPVAGVQDGKFEVTSHGPATEFRLDRPFLLVVHHGDTIIQIGAIAAPMAIE